MIDGRRNLARMTQMGGTTAQGFDPAALLVILVIAGLGVVLGVVALRRRPKVPRWAQLKRYRKRLDVIRRDLDRMAEYTGNLRDSPSPAGRSFELGLSAMTACRWSQAIEHFREARTSAARPELIPLLVQLGVCHYLQGSLVESLNELGESSRLADREGDKPGRASALANIGVIHHEYGEFGSALTHLGEALTIARETGNQRLTALCLGNTGNIQRSKAQFDDALKHHEDALAISRRIGDDTGVVSALGNIASVRRDKGELDKALELYAEAVETARRVNDNLGLAVQLGGIGGVYRDRGDLNRALTFHEESLAGARRIGFRLGVATELGNIGLILEKRGAHGQATSSLAEALAILLAVGVSRGQIQLLLGLSRCDDALGRERIKELLTPAAGSDESAIDIVDRVDQIRRRRPWPRPA